MNKLWFVIGGVGDAPNNAFNAPEFNDVWVLDTEAWLVAPGREPVLHFAYHTAALTGDKIFLFGLVEDMLYNDVMMLDTTSSAWKVVQEGAAAKRRRCRHSASRGSGTRISFGGWDGARTCGELLELETSDWIRSDNVPRMPPKPTVNDGTGGGGGAAAAAAARALRQRHVGSGRRHQGGRRRVGVAPAPRRLRERGKGARPTRRASAGRRRPPTRSRNYAASSRPKMSNEVLTKELHKMGRLSAPRIPPPTAPVSTSTRSLKRELESIRVELSKLRRQGSQDHEALRLEVQQIKRARGAKDGGREQFVYSTACQTKVVGIPKTSGPSPVRAPTTSAALISCPRS